MGYLNFSRMYAAANQIRAVKISVVPRESGELDRGNY